MQSLYVILSIIWLPRKKHWLIITGTVTFTQCESLCFGILDLQVTRSFVTRLGKYSLESIDLIHSQAPTGI